MTSPTHPQHNGPILNRDGVAGRTGRRGISENMPEETTVAIDAIVAELQGNPVDMPYRNGGGQ